MSLNIKRERGLVSIADRNKQSGHKAAVLWFTGLSGAGKSTLAHAVEKALFDRNCRTFVIDGDNVRHGLCTDLGFSADDRHENIRRIGEMSKLFLEAGLITLTAFISPFQSDRDRVRSLFKEDEFIEVYCAAELSICEKRDVKGLYNKARKGLIREFTGISSPYEVPLNPELILYTDMEPLHDCVEKVLSYLKERCIIQ